MIVCLNKYFHPDASTRYKTMDSVIMLQTFVLRDEKGCWKTFTYRRAAIMVECRGILMGVCLVCATPYASRRREWREAHGQRQTEDIIFYLRFYSTFT